ncbi:potassium-transporting ATPase KdpC subunit [Frondihabitans sucicola]|uniref:Potassium-transporting ATPase KdpC subunit n=1 Tax=Frondihabitans sucicola TaxID=1268041 RepID=A0ABM8GHT9_9MICO|nr:potassium-transporting ATPase subunit KdpC [Frondihabitans sucicola]BDZ47937.1 potassium-transporting ATPase KdpC subunit [Frondihabitans sucicola]
MNTRTLARQWWVAIRAMLVFTVVLGIAYTAAVTGVGQLVFPHQANGSTASAASGRIVGSSLIGQSFTSPSGKALPGWFQSRPSAAGKGYDATASSASNYGPDSPDLVAAVKARRAAVAASDGVPLSRVPADAVTASGSGLDPDISPAYALLQVDRVAHTRGLSTSVVHKLVESKIEGREAGYLGEQTVNVLELNIALASLSR